MTLPGESASSRASSEREAPAGWSRASLALFGVIILALTALVLFRSSHRPPIVHGLPDDEGVRVATEILRGSWRGPTAGLRFATSWAAEPAGPNTASPGPTDPSRLAEAERALREAKKRLRGDPRIECLLGHVDLARHRFEDAEKHYTAAARRASRYGEARLALAVTLALHARTEGDGRRSRALLLQAIAQLAAVEEGDPFHLPALYDRAVLLEEVRRPKDAAAAARKYLALEPSGPWADSLRRIAERSG